MVRLVKDGIVFVDGVRLGHLLQVGWPQMQKGKAPSKVTRPLLAARQVPGPMHGGAAAGHGASGGAAAAPRLQGGSKSFARVRRMPLFCCFYPT